MKTNLFDHWGWIPIPLTLLRSASVSQLKLLLQIRQPTYQPDYTVTHLELIHRIHVQQRYPWLLQANYDLTRLTDAEYDAVMAYLHWDPNLPLRPHPFFSAPALVSFPLSQPEPRSLIWIDSPETLMADLVAGYHTEDYCPLRVALQQPLDDLRFQLLDLWAIPEFMILDLSDVEFLVLLNRLYKFIVPRPRFPSSVYHHLRTLPPTVLAVYSGLPVTQSIPFHLFNIITTIQWDPAPDLPEGWSEVANLALYLYGYDFDRHLLFFGDFVELDRSFARSPLEPYVLHPNRLPELEMIVPAGVDPVVFQLENINRVPLVPDRHDYTTDEVFSSLRIDLRQLTDQALNRNFPIPWTTRSEVIRYLQARLADPPTWTLTTDGTVVLEKLGRQKVVTNPRLEELLALGLPIDQIHQLTAFLTEIDLQPEVATELAMVFDLPVPSKEYREFWISTFLMVMKICGWKGKGQPYPEPLRPKPRVINWSNYDRLKSPPRHLPMIRYHRDHSYRWGTVGQMVDALASYRLGYVFPVSLAIDMVNTCVHYVPHFNTVVQKRLKVQQPPFFYLENTASSPAHQAER